MALFFILLNLFIHQALGVSAQDCPVAPSEKEEEQAPPLGKFIGEFRSVETTAGHSYGYRIFLFKDKKNCDGFAFLYHGSAEPYQALFKTIRCRGNSVSFLTDPSFRFDVEDEGPYSKITVEFKGNLNGSKLTGVMKDLEIKESEKITLNKVKTKAPYLNDDWERLHRMSDCYDKLVENAKPIEKKILATRGNRDLAGPEWEPPLCAMDEDGTPGFLTLVRSEKKEVIQKASTILSSTFTSPLKRNCLFEFISKVGGKLKDQDWEKLINAMTASIAENPIARARFFEDLLPPLKYGFQQCAPTAFPAGECVKYRDMLNRAVRVTEELHAREKRTLETCATVTDQNLLFCKSVEQDKKNIVRAKERLSKLSINVMEKAIKEEEKRPEPGTLDPVGVPYE